MLIFAWDYTDNELLSSLGTVLTNMISPVDNFLVLNFCTQGFQWGGGGGGGGGEGASLLENWILEGDERGNFPVNAFCFSVHRF